MTEHVHFEVGEKYENMKGVFEVIAIHRDSMDIRWEDGEEVSTPIALQQRIIERMRHEQELEDAQKAARTKKAKGGGASAAKPFEGVVDGDFSDSVTRTTWRGRGQLGGSLARQMKGGEFKFNSWAVMRKPEVHWLDMKRQKQSDLPLQAKFYARLEPKQLCFGFHLPRSVDAAVSDKGDWQALMTWLGKTENEDWLRELCTSLQLVVCDLTGKAFTGTIEACEGAWSHHQGDGDAMSIDGLCHFLSSAAENSPVDLRIEKRLEKSAAIEKEKAIVTELASLFESLIPLYRAVAVSGSMSA
ncbi:hypothetical protein DSCO28_11610 [Desulfosarcina ovata subsp. sediminis]|uniref:Uncharacterized protein n=1 Tax=Desulfosarcina ovata subsp. sediminis TaxID=885957 RepID=A0A5K7ZK27_9BACT|nr:hypothetical protein [Desulfosarcina ovata]BBO80595.1 hypothetical protein DSCO28_11610 [Desulfosarcina ovata subsp. sediminis]